MCSACTIYLPDIEKVYQRHSDGVGNQSSVSTLKRKCYICYNVVHAPLIAEFCNFSRRGRRYFIVNWRGKCLQKFGEPLVCVCVRVGTSAAIISGIPDLLSPIDALCFVVSAAFTLTLSPLSVPFQFSYLRYSRSYCIYHCNNAIFRNIFGNN